MSKRLLLSVCAAALVSLRLGADPAAADAEAKAVALLLREVPAWSRDNGCFSCHNNGDAARALYAASRKGHRIPAAALAATTAWLTQPNRWDENKGDPGFSDKRLANVQFAVALLTAVETGHVKEIAPLQQAARKLVADQGADGAWPIDAGNVVGSPATYGTPLATWMALRTLRAAGSSETKDAVRRAERALAKIAPRNVPAAATLLLSLDGSARTTQLQREQCLKFLRAAQTGDGGWGPYADAPPEAFDTALALLALAERRGQAGVAEMIRRGREFLAARQQPDGGWPATTRPAGGESYAQRMSTAGWATLALLATRD